jgi:hypothetical protein
MQAVYGGRKLLEHISFPDVVVRMRRQLAVVEDQKDCLQALLRMHSRLIDTDACIGSFRQSLCVATPAQDCFL